MPPSTQPRYLVKISEQTSKFGPASMKPSQNSLFKADAYVRAVAESGILGLVQVKVLLLKFNSLLGFPEYLRRTMLEYPKLKLFISSKLRKRYLRKDPF